MNQEKLKEILIALEQELLAPQVRVSAVRLGELLADEFVEFGSSGNIYDKKSIIHLLTQSESTEKYYIDDFRVVTAIEETALVIYTCEVRAEAGQPVRKSNRSSMWKMIGGNWKLVFHQGTTTE